MAFRQRKCKICGNKFIPLSRNNTICPNPECKAIGCKIAKAKYRKKRKAGEQKKVSEKIKKPETLAEADAKAREEGLSYGQRELRIWMEKQRMERRRSYGN
jgi:hypothetical protein